MDLPLTITSIMRYGTSVFGDGEVVTWTGDGTRRRTYAEAGRRAARLANALRGLGVQKGDRVSFICYNTHHLLEAYYGVLEAGAILNPINIRLAPPEIAYILNHAASKVLFYHKDFAPLVESIKGSLSATEHFVVVEGEPGGLAAHEYEALLAKAAAAKLLRTDKVRADTTVVEAAVAYPTDSGLLAKAIGSMARTVARIKVAGGATRTRVRDGGARRDGGPARSPPSCGGVVSSNGTRLRPRCGGSPVSWPGSPNR
jgi:non-ribosomal peptide synthetase component E (peptide arylation enzyme)